MLLKISHHCGGTEEYRVNKIEDLETLFIKYPMTEEIAKQGHHLKEILQEIAVYLSNHWSHAYIDDTPEYMWKSEQMDKALEMVSGDDWGMHKSFSEGCVKHKTHIKKSVIPGSIRTGEDRVYVSLDGDNIGASVERAAMKDDVLAIVNQSSLIEKGANIIKDWALKHDGDIYIFGGDDVAFTMPLEYINHLDALRELYHQGTGFTVSIGYGMSVSKAGYAMLYGKLNGKNQVNGYSTNVYNFLQRVSKPKTQEEKIQEHGLLGDDLEKVLKFRASKESPYTHIYRIEDKNGRGPYTSRGFDFNLEWQDKYHGDQYNTPGPAFDPGFHDDERALLESPVTKDYERIRENYGESPEEIKFGFYDQNQINKWFTPNELKVLQNKGFRVVKRKARRVWDSGKQVMFEPYDPTLGHVENTGKIDLGKAINDQFQTKSDKIYNLEKGLKEFMVAAGVTAGSLMGTHAKAEMKPHKGLSQSYMKHALSDPHTESAMLDLHSQGVMPVVHFDKDTGASKLTLHDSKTKAPLAHIHDNADSGYETTTPKVRTSIVNNMNHLADHFRGFLKKVTASKSTPVQRMFKDIRNGNYRKPLPLYQKGVNKPIGSSDMFNKAARDAIPPMSTSKQVEALNSLSQATKTRVNSEGRREFLLHRGVSRTEYDGILKYPGIVHINNSAWLTDRDMAEKYAGWYRDPRVVSAWIDEGKVLNVPRVYQINDSEFPGGKGVADIREVIVAPHSSELHLGNYDKLPGGLADAVPVEHFDKKELLEGIKVEMEHTRDVSLAAEIAMDHLTEDRFYYRKLALIETHHGDTGDDDKLTKALQPPKYKGEISDCGKYVAAHFKPLRGLAWHYKPEIAEAYDKEVDSRKQAYLSTVPDSHKEAMSNFIDTVRNNSMRHWVPARNGMYGDQAIRLRHLRAAMRGHPNYSIEFNNPGEIEFKIEKRHGKRPITASHWKFDAKFNKVFDLVSDKRGSGRLRRSLAKSASEDVRGQSLNTNPEGVPEVASVAVIDGDNLLMGRRLDNDKYTLPGGHLEEGEDPVQGAFRELKEEANIDPKFIYKLGSEQVAGKDGQNRIIHSFVAFGRHTHDTSLDPDHEVGKWNWISTKGGLPVPDTELHSSKNVTLKLLGLQKW